MNPIDKALFHILQRPANLGVAFYKRQAEEGPAQACAICGGEFASMLQISDLKQVLPELGFDYSTPDGNYQEVCPSCRRKLIGNAQAVRIQTGDAAT